MLLRSRPLLYTQSGGREGWLDSYRRGLKGGEGMGRVGKEGRDGKGDVIESESSGCYSHGNMDNSFSPKIELHPLKLNATMLTTTWHCLIRGCFFWLNSKVFCNTWVQHLYGCNYTWVQLYQHLSSTAGGVDCGD